MEANYKQQDKNNMTKLQIKWPIFFQVQYIFI